HVRKEAEKTLDTNRCDLRSVRQNVARSGFFLPGAEEIPTDPRLRAPGVWGLDHVAPPSRRRTNTGLSPGCRANNPRRFWHSRCEDLRRRSPKGRLRFPAPDPPATPWGGGPPESASARSTIPAARSRQAASSCAAWSSSPSAAAVRFSARARLSSRRA